MWLGMDCKKHQSAMAGHQRWVFEWSGWRDVNTKRIQPDLFGQVESSHIELLVLHLRLKKLVDCAMYSYRVSSLAVRFRFSMHFDNGWFTRGICKLCNSTWGDKAGDRSLKIGGRKGERRGRGEVHTKICFFLTLLCFILILTQVCFTHMWHGHEAWKLEPCGCPDF